MNNQSRISRRNLLKSAPVLVLAQSSWTSVRAQTFKAVPILQTLTTSTTVQLVVLRPKNDPFQYTYGVVRPNAALETPIRVPPIQVHEFEDCEWAVDWVLITGLKPSEDYKFAVYKNTGEILDQRLFRSLDIERKDLRIMIASCMHDDRVLSQKQMWTRVQNSKPDLMFWVGDCVYADHHTDGTAKGILNRHIQVRQKLEIFYVARLIPTLSTWDNHDFGIDAGAGDDFHLKEESKKFFWAFFGSDHFNRPERMRFFSKGPGVASALHGFGQTFLLMDDRSFRQKSGSHGRHWGDEQESWMYSQLDQAKGISWLMNGSQFFGAYRKLSECFEGDHPMDFRNLLRTLKQRGDRVMFVSGDVHFSEVMRIEPDLLGYESYEFTSSSIHSFSFPGNEYLGENPRRLAAVNLLNFMILDLKHESNALEIQVKCVGLLTDYFKLKIRMEMT